MNTTVFLTMAAVAAGFSHAAPLKSANLTKKVNDVRISESSRQAREAKEGDRLTGNSTVLTGRLSRAELTFPDRTITRIGANAAFRFNSGSRDMEIKQGSFLLQVPKNAGGATIRTSTVTAAITGTTTMMEYSPGKWVKFICLEGTAKLKNRHGDTVVVPPGRMVVLHPDAPEFPPPVVVNIQKMEKTSALMDRKTFGALNGEAEGAIDATIASQMDGKRNGSLMPGYLLEHGQMPKGGDGKNGGGPRSILSDIFNPIDRDDSNGTYPYNPNLPGIDSPSQE